MNGDSEVDKRKASASQVSPCVEVAVLSEAALYGRDHFASLDEMDKTG